MVLGKKKYCRICGYSRCRCQHNRCQQCWFTKCRCDQETCDSCGDNKCKCKKKCDKQKCKVKVKKKKEKKKPSKTVVSSKICGNILFRDEVTIQEIWQNQIRTKSIVDVSVFNSARSLGEIFVIVNRKGKNPVSFTVPPGNTNSVSVDQVESITVNRMGEGIIEGRFCLDAHFVIIDGKDKK